MPWKRESGTARGYINTDTGQRISYRAYRNLYTASNAYKPLDLPALAKLRSKQAAYNELVSSRVKLEQARRVAAINDRGLTPEQVQAAEAEALRVSRAAIKKDEQFKADVHALKRLSKISVKKRTKIQNEELVKVLNRLDQARGSKAEEMYLRRLPRVTRHRARQTQGRARRRA